MDKSMFKVGDTIKWKSSNKEKIGVVVAIVQPGYKPWGLTFSLADWLGSDRWWVNYTTRWGYGASRNHASYVIAVNGSTDKAKKRLYWPRVKGLEKTEGGDNS